MAVQRSNTQRMAYYEEPAEKRNPYLAEGISAHGRRGRGVRGRGHCGTRTRRRDIGLDGARREQRTPVARKAPCYREEARRLARIRRRRRIRMQRLAVCAWVVCILVLAISAVVRSSRVSAVGSGNAGSAAGTGAGTTQPSGILVQGLPAEAFAKHPDWTENFLTPNEYSRPGDELKSVTNLFVHYTANPGTSAAQNRSYFEQQKDTHANSVSSHFIIGYEGEILQCVPLDEIAYAVQTRNFDSISIECCYVADDGSFTEETYDSLVSLLAWLVDAYGLDADDILRHYDCGGKKCPLYYTEHEDLWEQLKKDVDKL